MLLRGAPRTVNELAEKLELTDNAIRAQLLALERDGLIRQSGQQRGHRKPHFAYELTAEAESLFPKAYDLLLNRVIAVLKKRLAPKELTRVLREAGRSLAADAPGGQTSLESRARYALGVLESIGGAAKLEEQGDKLIIESANCPMAAAVSEHPEICQLAEALLTEIMETPVREHCERGDRPRCRFEIRKGA